MATSDKTILAIDYGTKRIGLAIARGPLAEPLTIIDNDALAITKIKTFIEEEKARHIVIGLSENKMAQQTKLFAESLQKILSIPIEFIDETLSSYEMHLKLRQAKLSKKQNPIDHLVAAQLLQEWIDNQ